MINKNLLKTASSNFKRWNEALKSKKPQKVAGLYAEGTTFLPTMSGDLRLGKKRAEDYFKHFLLKNPVGKIVNQEVQFLGDDFYVHTGTYDFALKPKQKKEIVHARFTFVWHKEKDDWKIVHHHSSVKPN